MLSVQIREPLLTRLMEYHHQAGIPGTPMDTARALIEAMLDAPMQDGSMLKEARRRAWIQVRNHAYNEFQAHLSMMAKDMYRFINDVPKDEKEETK